MQAFHDQLLTVPLAEDSYSQDLARLTKAGLVQMAALKSDLAWGDWPSKKTN